MRTIKPRPVSPSIAKTTALFWAMQDPRCTQDAAHARIAHGEKCAACGMFLLAYAAALPQEWPDA